MRLKVDFIPHENFHKGIWLSHNAIPWYFFHPKKRAYKIPYNDSFYSTLDEPLQPIVQYLHSKNIPTTPSCSGHFDDHTTHKDIFDKLQLLKKYLKLEPIVLDDAETNYKYVYSNPNFEIPWEPEEFFDKIKQYQKKGVLGIQDSGNNLFNALSSDCYDVLNDGDIVMIIVNSKNEKDLQDKWSSIYNEIKRHL